MAESKRRHREPLSQAGRRFGFEARPSASQWCIKFSISSLVKAFSVSLTPVRRVTTPEEFADAVLFFLSPWARAVTGQNLIVDGGLVKG